MSVVNKTEDFYKTVMTQEVEGDIHDPSNIAIKNTNEDMRRAIEGLKEIPDEELQEFLNDEDFMEGLNVVDAWEGEEDRNREEQKPFFKEREQKPSPRERYRRERKQSYNKERPKREEKKREELRRDPSKSTKDIERDKLRAKRDNESKLLAEKEKAIKHLLDSDNVVPPGTETETLQFQSMTEKQSEEKIQRIRRSRERRRSLERPRLSPLRKKSYERYRASPQRRILSPVHRRSPLRISPEKRKSSPRMICERRTPILLSPERRRSPFRRLSWERRVSVERRWSAERQRRRTDLHERRRSRSRDRQRSRSMERLRRRSSRTPVNNRRYSPRRRSRTCSRSPERRTRKRSPFINELTRQLRNEGMIPPSGYIPPPTMDRMATLMNASAYQETENRAPLSQPYMQHQVGPPAAPSLPSVLPGSGPPGSSGFMNFDVSGAPPPMGFDSSSLHPIPPAHYSSAPVLYNQANPMQTSTQPIARPSLLSGPVGPPQPVPAPGPSDHHSSLAYNSPHGITVTNQHLMSPNKSINVPMAASTVSQDYNDYRPPPAHNGCPSHREERLKTPEPPVISDMKQFEKTSLSSLLEASVSAKDSTSPPVLYPGFKPEILRHCEHALRELPLEDPRLKTIGRFFFDPNKENLESKLEEYPSNSVLLQRGKNKIYWEEVAQQCNVPVTRSNVQMHQKICQTDEIEMEAKAVQTNVETLDFEMQVYPHDLQNANKEEKKPIMDRLDWNVRETFESNSKYREVDDLRWSLSNPSQKRSWKKGLSPARSNDREYRPESAYSSDHGSRNMRLDSPGRSRDGFPAHRGGSMRDHYVRERYSPDYRRPVDDRDEFHEGRSNHSRGESPMELDSEEELQEPLTFQRRSDWHGRGKPFRGKSNPMMKTHLMRGKHSGRPYRGRGTFHKF